MNKITPCLWFNNNAEEAVTFYTSIFKNSRITSTQRCGKEGPGPEGSVLTIAFELEGQSFMALNGGPKFRFTEAISLVVDCRDQAEVDALWSKLTSRGGQESQCGWLKDRFGLSWQIIPAIAMKLIWDMDPAKSARAMQAVLTMSKIDIEALQKAHAG